MNGYGNGRIRRADAYRRPDPEPEEEPAADRPEYAGEPYPDGGLTEEENPEAEYPEETYPEEAYPEEAFTEEPPAGTEPEEAAQPETDDEAADPLEQAQQLATNRTVMLACTLAAMMSPFAAFLLWAEKKSRAIRHNSVQSVALGVLHLVTAAVCFGLMALLGQIPLIGFAVTLCGWLLYFGVLIWVVSVRLRLMRRAWLGLRYDIPLIGGWLERFV